MGWWSDPVGSKPGKARETKSSYWTSSAFSKAPKATETKSGKMKVAKCPACGKGPRQCRCHDVGDAVKTRGRTAQTHDRVESSGVIWCGVCRSRINPRNGVCMNITCSSRQ